MPRAVRLLLLSCLTTLVVVGTARRAHAQAEVTWTDAPLAEALYEFADRTGIELVFAVRLVEDIRVSGRYNLSGDPNRALSLILRGTGVRAERIRAGQYVLIKLPLNVVAGGQDQPGAYTGTLDGRVVDASTGEPLWGAHVWLVELGLGDAAAEDGTFAVRALPTGRYAVRFSFVGYRPVRLELDVFPDSPRLPPTIRLQQEAIASTDAVVEEGGPDPGVEPGVVDLEARQASAIPYRFSDGDLAATLSWLPGLSRTGGASGAIVVRGADPNQTRTLRDGVPLYEPWHAFGLLSAFQPEALGSIRLHRGALPASLSGALAAVLDVETTDALAGDTSGVVDIGPVMARVVADARLGRIAGVHVSARRSTLGLLVEPRVRISEGAVVLDPVGGRPVRTDIDPYVGFDDAEGKVSFRLRERMRLDIAASGGRDGIRVAVADAPPEGKLEYRWETHTLSGRFRSLLASRTLVEALAYRSGHHSEEMRPAEVSSRRSAQTLIELGASGRVEHYVSAEHEVQGGVSVASRRLSARLFDGETQVDPENVLSTELALYLSDRWTPARGWKVQPGLRFETLSADGQLSHIALSPRFFVRWTPAPDELVFRAGVSRQTQSVHRLRARAADGYDLAASRWLLASRTAPLSSAWQAGTGAEWAPSSAVAFSADLYGRWSTGLPEPIAAAVAEPGVDPADLARLFPAHDGRAVGLELAARTALNQWTIGMTAALSRTEVRRSAQEQDWRPARFDRPVLLGVLAERRTQRYSVSVRLDVESGTVRLSGERAPAEARAGLSVGMRFDLLGVQWGARAQAVARPRFDSEVAVPSELGLPLATDVSGFSAIPLISLSARW